MSRRTPTRQDLLRFCRIEGWSEVRSARGRTGSHHLTFELHLADGRILRTRLSRPADRTDIGSGLFAHILRDQLQVTADEFWECVDNGTPPSRTGPEPSKEESLPAEVVHLLKSKVGLSDTEIRKLDKDAAVETLNHFWAYGTGPD